MTARVSHTHSSSEDTLLFSGETPGGREPANRGLTGGTARANHQVGFCVTTRRRFAMRTTNWLVLTTMATLAAACGRSRSPAADDALKNDLALASQTQAYNPQQFISPTEAGYAGYAGYAGQPNAPRATPAVARQPVSSSRPSSTARRSTASRSSSGNGGYYPAPAPPTTTEKHTGRDAAIGAAAGAVLGAVSSRDKVKGGLIGAAAGGILGAVIGNNVDVKKKTGW